MTVKLLNKQHLEFLSLKVGCTGSYESTLVKMPHCWKPHVTAQFCGTQIFHTGLDARKLDLVACKQQRCRSANVQSDQRLCYFLPTKLDI